MRRSSSLVLIGVAIVALIALPIVLQLSACSGAGQSLKQWSGAFAGCEKEDLGQLVQSGDLQVTLLSDVSLLIQGDAASLEDDLGKLALGVGMEAVHCAIMASEGVLTPRGLGSAAPRAVPPGLARAKAWDAAHASQGKK